jgi:hypothetical protein
MDKRRRPMLRDWVGGACNGRKCSGSVHLWGRRRTVQRKTLTSSNKIVERIDNEKMYETLHLNHDNE